MGVYKTDEEFSKLTTDYAVDTIQDRNSINLENVRCGSTCYVIDTKQIFILGQTNEIKTWKEM